ncbi:MAG TPA: uroporphyrinogen-III synthase [Terriglobales bacterium]|nr:uroporphyrinogen-III synthase [Terriglobales bacterium]
MTQSKPLAGVRVLVTRAQRQAGKLSAALRGLGAGVVEIPSIEIRPPRSYRPLDAALERVAEYDWLVLTSVNGVEALFARPGAKGRGGWRRALRGVKVAAIGPATRAALAERGLRVALTPKKYVAESVVEALRSRVRGKRVLLVRARVARDVIPAGLRAAGAHVDVVEAYQTAAPAGSVARLRAVLGDAKRRPDVITFTSSSTARNFVEMLGDRRALRGVMLASIGPVTSGTLRELGLRVDVEAREYTVAGLVRAIRRLLASGC